MTLVKVSQGAYSVADGKAVESTVNHSITCHIIDYDERLRRDGFIKENERKAVIAAKGMTVEPEIDDRIIDGDSKQYEVHKVQRIKKGSTKLAFICKVGV